MEEDLEATLLENLQYDIKYYSGSSELSSMSESICDKKIVEILTKYVRIINGE